jgi:prephenate dehydrogenase
MAPHISADTIVIDCCGTKRKICRRGLELAERYGFTYAGGHPMAGTQYSGFAHSRQDMFKGESMIIVPPGGNDIALLDRIKKLLAPAGFTHITVTTAENHDRMIAYTSQMAHVVSNAFVKSPRAQRHKGYSAGSYKDLTRVAWLNAEMWTAIFLENSDFLLDELRILQQSLSEYLSAIERGDALELKRLLADGVRCKEMVDSE